jgi:hypothetical protein
MEEWSEVLPEMPGLEKANQKSLALQAVMLVMESVFEQVPELQEFRFFLRENQGKVWAEDIRHPEEDPQYGIPAHLARTVNEALAPLADIFPWCMECLRRGGPGNIRPRSWRVDASLVHLFSSNIETILGMSREELVFIRTARRLDHCLAAGGGVGVGSPNVETLGNSGSARIPRARL